MTHRTRSRAYDDQAIEAAFLHTMPNCYFVGPFSRRVSFASQQVRAIDLISALETKKRLVNPETGERLLVAVIGAGIAGLTAAAMLRGHKCQVHIYESEVGVLHLQGRATHRLIHPTISRWPAYTLDYTTEFGFLDWYTATSDQVIAAMKRDWIARTGPQKPNDHDYRCFEKARVTKIISGDKISLLNAGEAGSDAEAAQEVYYDLAIVTVGFGQEEIPEGLNGVSYWTADQVDHWRKSAGEAHVSGCGDGGLIDCLRLIHGRFDDGWLTLKLAQLLEAVVDPEVLSEIEAAEDEALLIAKSIRCMGIANPDEARLTAMGEKVFQTLSKFYTEFVKRLPGPALALLDKSIKDSKVKAGKVTMVSRETAPFSPYAAPIHKIMLAHAMQKNFVVYKQGKLRPDGDHAVFEFDDASTPDKRLAPGAPLVIRHGSISTLTDLVGPREVESLRLRQFMLADFLEFQSDRIIHAPPAYASEERMTKAYYRAYLTSVEELMQTLRPASAVGWDVDGFVWDMAGDEDPITEYPLLVPNKVFGANLRKGAIEEVPAL